MNIIKYYVADEDKNNFLYLYTIPAWCRDKVSCNLRIDNKPHFVSLQRAKTVLAKAKKLNCNNYKIFEILMEI